MHEDSEAESVVERAVGDEPDAGVGASDTGVPGIESGGAVVSPEDAAGDADNGRPGEGDEGVGKEAPGPVRRYASAEAMEKVRAARRPVAVRMKEREVLGWGTYSQKEWDKRCTAYHRLNAQKIQEEQRMLRKLTLLEDIAQPKVKKRVRRQLEKISLLFAADSQTGDEFRKNVALAVDLSGYKREVNEKIKRQGQKKAERAKAQSDLVDRQRMIEREQKQQAEGPQEF